MNIFVVDNDPVRAARDLCDQHVSKMHTESVQLLVSLANNLDIEHSVFTKSGSRHKGGYPNHPCCKWLQEDIDNVRWLLNHSFELCEEHRHRFGRQPFSLTQLVAICGQILPVLERTLPRNGMTTRPQCMPEECRQPDVVQAYRSYYIEHKSSMARWRHCDPPSWFTDAFDFGAIKV